MCVPMPRTGIPMSEPQRLQKVLAAAGVASRRASELLIAAGRVRVDGRVVTELGTRVDPEQAVVEVDGQRVQVDPGLGYYALNKPAGVVSTMHDDHGRRDLSDFAVGLAHRVYNVGRLDEPTRGLLLLTNDGQLAHRLMHPSFEVAKVYLAQVSGRLRAGDAARLRQGIELEDGPIRADRVQIVSADRSAAGDRTLVRVTLHSGRNRIVRRMLAAVGHPVLDLVRLQEGPIHLGDLPAGRVRPLTRIEVGQLLAEVADAAPVEPGASDQPGKEKM